MVRDYSAFLPGGKPLRREPTALERLDWSPAFARQIDTDALATGVAPAKGRHTTTRRELHAPPGGCLVLDTPGMRELQLTDTAAGIADVFEDIEALTARWRKLQAADAFNSATLAERRKKDGAFGKLVRRAMNAQPQRRR